MPRLVAGQARLASRNKAHHDILKKIISKKSDQVPMNQEAMTFLIISPRSNLLYLKFFQDSLPSPDIFPEIPFVQFFSQLHQNLYAIVFDLRR